MWWRRRRTPRWAAPCRDEVNRRQKLVVAPLGEGKVLLVTPPGGVAVLTMLAVGELRAALRDAVFALADPELDREYEIAIRRARP